MYVPNITNAVFKYQIVVCFLLGDSPASDLYMHIRAYINQTPGNHPKENKQHSEHGESLKSRSTIFFKRNVNNRKGSTELVTNGTKILINILLSNIAILYCLYG